LTRQAKTRYSDSMSKIKIVLILFLITLLFLASAIVYFLSKSKRGSNYQGQVKNETTGRGEGARSHFSLDNKATTLPTWKIYIHPKFKYEIKYPSNWEKDSWNIQEAVNVKGAADGNIWSHTRLQGENKRLEILAWGNKAQTPILQWLRWYRHEDLNLDALPKEPNFSFLGSPAVRIFQEKTSFTYPVVRIFFQKEDKLFEILYRMDSLKGMSKPADYQLIEEPYTVMLQSYKFTP